MFSKFIYAATQALAYIQPLVQEVSKIAGSISSIDRNLARIADHVDPPSADIVGSPYIANKLGCTTVWVAEMAQGPTSQGVRRPGNRQRQALEISPPEDRGMDQPSLMRSGRAALTLR